MLARELQAAQKTNIFTSWSTLEPALGENSRGNFRIGRDDALDQDERVVLFDLDGPHFPALVVESMDVLDRVRLEPFPFHPAGHADQAIGGAGPRRRLDIDCDEKLAVVHTALRSDDGAGTCREPDARRACFAALRHPIRVAGEHSLAKLLVRHLRTWRRVGWTGTAFRLASMSRATCCT